jgi:maleylpyruvate isomerase
MFEQVFAMIAGWYNPPRQGWMGPMAHETSRQEPHASPHDTALPLLSEIIEATTRYLESLTVLTDEDCRRPSALPGWTRGHVVSHLSRNADALSNLMHWAQNGVETPMYPSAEAREADIEAGAWGSAEELREDAAASWGRFLQAANELHSARLDVKVSRTPGSHPFSVRNVGRMRRTEVEVHHADLLVGYGPQQWPRDFVAHLLDRRRKELAADARSMTWRLTDTGETISFGDADCAGPEIAGPSADLAWWLVGRGTGEALVSTSGSLPDIGRWS